jgi:predicted phage terminase large subunit-like protein
MTIDLIGRLYQNLKTYENLPKNDQGEILGEIKNYTDTADEGDCYLCSINYLEYEKQAYILNILYTQDAMEVTESATAKLLEGVKEANIESNNGGRGFARAVQVKCREFNNYRTVINWFHQSGNKDARINTWSAWVQQNIYFPLNWSVRWPDFYKHITMFIRNGENKYKDAPDVLTGIGEMITVEKQGTVIKTTERKNRY